MIGGLINKQGPAACPEALMSAGPQSIASDICRHGRDLHGLLRACSGV
jgi:hypothetical protein